MNDDQKTNPKAYNNYYETTCDGCNQNIEEAEPNRVAYIKLRANGLHILEVSCLTGGITKSLLQLGRKLTALDISPKFCAKTTELCSDYIKDGWLNVQQGAFEDFDASEMSLDTVLMSELLEHVIDPAEVLKKALRISDHIVITVPWRAYFNSPEHLREYYTLEDLQWIFDIEPGLRWEMTSIQDSKGVVANIGIELWRNQ